MYWSIWILIYISKYMNSDNIFLLKSPLYFHVVLSLRSPGCPSLSPTNVRHFLTSPVVNLLTSYPRATKKKHQNVRTFPSAIDEIQTILASITCLCALEMFVGCSQTFSMEIRLFKMLFNSEVLLQDTNVACWLPHFPLSLLENISFTTRKLPIHEE